MAVRVVGPEDAWLAQIAQGDDGAFESLVRAWTPRVHSFILRMVRDRQLAEELTQDTFLKVWRGATSFDPSRGRGSSWIFSIAHHQTIDRLRAQRVRGAAVTEARVDLEGSAMAVPTGVDPIHRLRMEKALAELSFSQRQAVELAYFGGFSREEMAERLGIPVGTAKTRLRDALIRLRNAYGEDEPAPLDPPTGPSCGRGA